MLINIASVVTPNVGLNLPLFLFLVDDDLISPPTYYQLYSHGIVLYF